MLKAPGWASSMIRNWRKKANIPDEITDDQVFTAIEETGVTGIDGEDTEEEIESIRGYLDM